MLEIASKGPYAGKASTFTTGPFFQSHHYNLNGKLFLFMLVATIDESDLILSSCLSALFLSSFVCCEVAFKLTT